MSLSIVNLWLDKNKNTLDYCPLAVNLSNKWTKIKEEIDKKIQQNIAYFIHFASSTKQQSIRLMQPSWNT